MVCEINFVNKSFNYKGRSFFKENALIKFLYMLVLLVNVLMYFMFFLIDFKRTKSLTPYNFLLFFYAIIAMCGYIICDIGVYEYNIIDISIIPYFYAFLYLLIIIAPLRRYVNLLDFNYNKTIYVRFIKFVCICSIVYSFLLFLFYLIANTFSYNELYEMKTTEESIRLPNKYLNVLFFTLSRFINTCIPFALLFLFERLRDFGRIKDLIFLFLIVLPQILFCILVSNRGGIFFSMLTIFFFVLLYFRKLTIKIRKIIIITGISLFLLTSFYSILITSSRVENKVWTNETESLLHYFGESFPNLGTRLWNLEYINHPYGRREFPIVYNFLTDSNEQHFYSSKDRSLYWVSYTKAPVINFLTGFGDLYVEFGLALTILVAFIINRIFNFLYSRYKYYSVALMCINYNLAVFGLFNFKGESFLSEIIWCLIIIASFKILNKSKNVNSHRR